MSNVQTKSTTTRYAILTKEFTYDVFGKSTCPVGSKFQVGTKGKAFRLTDDGLLILSGVAEVIIPNDYFDLVDEQVDVVTTTTTIIVKKGEG